MNKEIKPVIRDNGKSRTIYVRIPSAIVKLLKITKRDWLTVEVKDNKIIYILERK